MTERPPAILIATPGEQHTDMLLMSCVLAALRPPEAAAGDAAREVILVSGGGPDPVVARILNAARCDTVADLFDRLAPGQFDAQVVETGWRDSPFWMIDDAVPIGRVVLLGHDATARPQVLEFAAQRRAAFAGASVSGARVRFHFGRREPAAPGSLLADDLRFDPAPTDPPHIGMAAIAASMLTCWLEDLDARVDRTADQHVNLDLASPREESSSSSPVEAWSDPPAAVHAALVSAGGLMSNLALLLAVAFPGLRGTISDDDTFTPDQWRYWVIRLLSTLAGCKVDRTREVIQALSPAAHILPCLERIDEDNADARLLRSNLDTVVTAPDSDICRSLVADVVSQHIARGAPPRAHALAGARDFGAEVYVETAQTAPADQIMMLADRAAVDRAAGAVAPTSCGDPRTESGVVICNLIAAGLLVAELARVLAGAPATGCLWRYALDRNAVRAYGPFARGAERQAAEAQR